MVATETELLEKQVEGTRINIVGIETPKSPLFCRAWMKFEQLMAITTAEAAIISFYPSKIALANIGGLTIGPMIEPSADPVFLGTTVILASTYGLARGLRVGAREAIIMIQRAVPGV